MEKYLVLWIWILVFWILDYSIFLYLKELTSNESLCLIRQIFSFSFQGSVWKRDILVVDKWSFVGVDKLLDFSANYIALPGGGGGILDGGDKIDIRPW